MLALFGEMGLDFSCLCQMSVAGVGWWQRESCADGVCQKKNIL